MSPAGYSADWPVPANLRTWQTVRAGGVSRGSWASLNLAGHVGDQPGAVAENRGLLARALALPAEPRWLEQVHGTRILRLDQGETGNADGAVTATPGVVLAVMTADCLPVLLASIDGRRIGVAHAGWRGLANGVLAAAVAAFDRAPSELTAWLGPAIGRGAFEVGAEVRAAFMSGDAAAANFFTPNARGRWQADLDGLARRQLRRSGVAAIHGQPQCTFSNPDRYFSHRREAPCGRMATLIWMEQPVGVDPGGPLDSRDLMSDT
jgi:YfiH family protein